ncbi:MAG: GAF domain-containing protein [Chloroflexota bacterium]|nr:GAF domain-containing protein [Chloroflexota bacterium]
MSITPHGSQDDSQKPAEQSQALDGALTVHLASESSNALSASRVVEQAEQSPQPYSRESATLSTVARTLMETLDVETILDRLLGHVNEVLNTEATSVALLDQETGELVFHAASGIAAAETIDLRLQPGEGIAGWVMQHQTPQLVPDVYQDSRFYAGVDAETQITTRSLICVPLKVKGRVIGVVEALNKLKGDFDARDLALLEAVAAPAATAIENARLYEAEQHKRRVLAALHRAGERLLRVFTTDEVLSVIASITREEFRFDRCWLGLIDEQRRTLIGRAGYGIGITREIIHRNIPLDSKPVSPAAICVLERTPVLINDALHDPRCESLHDTLQALHISSFATVPIVAGEEVLGVIGVDNVSSQRLVSKQDVDALMELGNLIRLALERVRLYEGLEEKVEERTQELQETQELYRLLIDAAGTAGEGIVLLQDVDEREGAILYANGAFGRMLGYTYLELLTLTIADLLPAEELGGMLSRHREQGMGRTLGQAYETVLVTKWGQRLPVAVGTATAEYEGRTATILFARDITAQKHFEEEINQRNWELQARNAIAALVGRSLSQENMLNSAMGVIASVTGMGMVAVRLRDEATGVSRFAACQGFPAEFIAREERAESNDALGEWTRRTGQPTVVGNTAESSPPHLPDCSLCTQTGVAALAIVPVEAAGNRLGMLYVGSHVLWAISHSEVDTLVAIGQQLGVAIENARMLEEIRRAETRYRTLMTEARDGIVVVDTTDDSIVDGNYALADMTGLSPAELRGMKVWQLNPPEAADDVRRLVTHIVEQGQGEADDLPIKHKDGSMIPVEIRARVIDLGDQQVIMAVIRDVTEKRGMEQHLIRSEKLTATGQLAASLAHEINNPLQGMALFLDALERTLDPDHPGRKELQMVRSGQERIRDVVQGLLAFQRDSQATLHPTDLHSSLRQTLAIVAPRFAASNITVHEMLVSDRAGIMSYPGQFNQVFLNLLLNAADAMPEGGKIWVRSQVTPDEVCIEIQDTGCGMSEEALDRLFEPFFSTKGTEAGTGLGLWVSHQIVTFHHGRIDVHSQIGEGTTFTIRLPRTTKALEEARVL